jgi:hypothetical protein
MTCTLYIEFIRLDSFFLNVKKKKNCQVDVSDFIEAKKKKSKNLVINSNLFNKCS